MAQASIRTRALLGMHAPLVTVETHLPGGLPGFTLVGLPETAVREARDRVKSALQTCGFAFPRGRVVVNLAPADLVKEGARYDLAIAVSILCATGQVPVERASDHEYLGELSLYGDVRPVRGVLGAVTSQQREHGALIVPTDNAPEVARFGSGRGTVLALAHLQQLAELLRTPGDFDIRTTIRAPVVETQVAPSRQQPLPSLSRVVGQQAAKRALLVAAAGGHHLLMVGPPGAGKTLLARCLSALLPPLPTAQAVEVAGIYSAAGLGTPDRAQPPFREPHHSISAAAMAGSGTKGRVSPGEVSLAHCGVLFLDELPHFKPSVLELLREPMSNGQIAIARAGTQMHFPARFQLLAAMNPCPAGQTCETGNCRCSMSQLRNYQRRLSGPLLDRIDLQLALPAVDPALLLNPALTTSSAAVTTAKASPAAASESAQTSEDQAAAEQILAARERQWQRQGRLNADGEDLTANQLQPDTQRLLLQAAERLKLTARGIQRTVRVAQTCADLDGADRVSSNHLTEALAYRGLDWGNFLGMAGGMAG